MREIKNSDVRERIAQTDLMQKMPEIVVTPYSVCRSRTMSFPHRCHPFLRCHSHTVAIRFFVVIPSPAVILFFVVISTHVVIPAKAGIHFAQC